MTCDLDCSLLQDRVRNAEPGELDEIFKAISSQFAMGRLAECEYEQLDSEVQQRRTFLKAIRTKGTPSLAKATKASRFISRSRPRSVDRKTARDRRRTLGGSSALPPSHREYYTEGQRAVLFVIGQEIKIKKVCDLSIEEIGRRSGVCRTMVQGTLHEGRLRGHLHITERKRAGAKNLTNKVSIICNSWLRWLQSHPTVRLDRVQNSKIVSPTKSQKSLAVEEKEGERWENLINLMNPKPDRSRDCAQQDGAVLAIALGAPVRLQLYAGKLAVGFMADTALARPKAPATADFETVISRKKLRMIEDGQEL
jgi:hypothetical protein